jgi:type I restriction-modification system DNA methylase subunit
MNSQIKAIKNLINKFKVDEAKFISSSSTYQEAEARVEFIDPFFTLLGWEMSNASAPCIRLRDVLREESQLTEKSTKKPDYTFRIATVRKFFVEAKRPSIDVSTHKESAFQIRSYGFTRDLPISVLTNFRTLRIYNTRLEPKSSDDADVGLLMSVDYEDYLIRFEEIFKVLGRDQVADGAIERTLGISPSGIIPTNASFLNRINKWRIQIAQDLHTRYSSLSIDELSDFSQKIINRIVFIRMCEDRGIEGEDVLREVAKKRDFIELRSLFKRMDNRYNTGLFAVAIDRLQDSYEIDTDVFLQIVDEIYTPNSPYIFSVLDADFLGQIYELFLVQRLAINSAGAVELQYKPAYEHREIITTPQPLVDEVVRRVFESKFNQLQTITSINLNSITSIRVCDVAVGSGRFLLRAFDELIEAAIVALRDEEDQTLLYCVSDNNYRLAFKVKKKIMENCLFGIDIDYNAVEIARFSLMVRLLEDETRETLPDGRKILPNIDKNIINGNTVVETDFPLTAGPVFDRTLPLNWNIAGLPDHFHVVIGNPPYLKTEEMIRDTPKELEYYKTRYKTPYKQFDKYFVFIELALAKMEAGSWFAMVIPNKWITIEAGTKLRNLLATNGLVSEIVDFGSEHLFEGKSAYVCMLILTKDGANNFFYHYVNNYQEFLSSPQRKGFSLPETLLKTVGGSAWVLPSSKEEAFVLGKLTANSIPLSKLADIKNGIQTSANDVFLIDSFEDRGEFVEFEKNGVRWVVEKSITRPYINNSARVVSYQPIHADALIIFPYQQSANSSPIPIMPNVMKRDFPKAMLYLKAHKKQLRERSVSPPPKSGVFYAYGRQQALEVVFSAPKIIYSVIQKGDKYAIDNTGVAYASGGTAGEVAIFNPRNGFALEFFLGLLNQRAVEFFARKRGSPFGGGWYARGSAVLADIPVPDLNIAGNEGHRAMHDAIVSDVLELIQTQQQLQSASGRGEQALKTRKTFLGKSLELKFNTLWDFAGEVQSLVLPGEAI